MREYTPTIDGPIRRKTKGGFVWGGYVERGPRYRAADGTLQPFLDEDGRNYIGLLNTDGWPLAIGEPICIRWFKIRAK